MKLAPIIAVVGPSGVGKDSVIQALMGRKPGFQRATRVITRPEGEDDEKFERVSENEFQKLIEGEAFALHWAAHGMQYGISREIQDQRRVADKVLVNLSRTVLFQAQEIFSDMIVISLTADPEVLARRLSERGRESSAEQTRRLDRADAPLPEGLDWVIEVDNSGPLDATLDEILYRLQSERP